MRRSRIERRNEWRDANRRTNGEPNQPWVSTVDPRYEPVEVKSKKYASNGKREVARRLRQAGEHYNPEWLEQMGA
jgi:hypothetical protein